MTVSVKSAMVKGNIQKSPGKKKCNGKAIQQVRVVVFFQRTWVQFQYPATLDL